MSATMSELLERRKAAADKYDEGWPLRTTMGNLSREGFLAGWDAAVGTYEIDATLLVDVLLLCTRCRQPIKARINTPNWLRVEWIGLWGECLKCYQQVKEANDE